MNSEPDGDPAFELGPGPSEARLDRAARLLHPFLRVFDPHIEGLENVPEDTGALWIGNHTMIGMLDYAVFMLEIYRAKGVTFWSLGDHFHFKVPVWRDLLEANGTFPGTIENCLKVFARDGNIVIFPGGAREVTKRPGQAYQLLWGDRLGFARLAIRAGVPIIPFACVGGDDWYKVVFDTRHLLATPVGRPLDAAFARAGMSVDAYLPSLIRGIGPTLVPRPFPLEFAIAPPVRPSAFADLDEEDAATALRDEVRSVLETTIADTLKGRREREHVGLGDRLRARVFGPTHVPR
ncbi:MAG: acyltransferase family protein [Acidimicrobiia bacterium]|nr:acyltransferase family protein [Acidimicrobiia bacterium]